MNTHNTEDTTTERQSSTFDYHVEKVMLYDAAGNPTGFYGTQRSDTMKTLGCVTSRYGVVQNSEFFGQAEQLFDKLTLGERKRKIVVTHGGARAHAIYDFVDKRISVGEKKKDDLILRLKVQNSFDGTIGASFQVGMFRIICSNGLAVPSNTVSVMKKHTMSINTEFFQSRLEEAINNYSSSLPLFNRMSQTIITQKQGHNALKNMSKRKVLSERIAESIGQIWEAPRYEEDKERTIWSLYNAATQHLTHEISNKRFDLAERSTTGVLRVLSSEGLRAGSELFEFTENASNN